MNSIISAIVSNIIYDLLKGGMKLTFYNVFGGFYGNGIFQNKGIYDDFLEKINKENDMLEKEKTVQDILSEEFPYTEMFEKDLYNTNFAKRLDYVMYIINKTRMNNRKINLEYLGEFLGFDSVNELKKYYKYEEEPTYTFCEEIAKKLGINAEWFKRGDIGEEIFKTKLPRIYYAEEFLEVCDSKEYEFHFVIKDDVDKREIIVVRRYNELKFEYYPCPIVFNSKVGGTGSQYLLSLYYFLKSININRSNEILNIHMVSEDIFYEILNGKEYCGIIEQYSADNLTTIFDDFLDIYHRQFHSEYYGDWYGEDFLKTQEKVRQLLQKEL